MTHATKAVMRLLVSDFIKLLGSSRGGALYSDQDLLNCIDKIEVVDYHHTVEVKGIKFCGYAAGHVLGAAMFTISIDGVVVLYTGDYSMEEDRCDLCLKEGDGYTAPHSVSVCVYCMYVSVCVACSS